MTADAGKAVGERALFFLIGGDVDLYNHCGIHH